MTTPRHHESLIKYLKTDFEHRDERGALVQIFREGWSQVNIIHSIANANRGGHYHKHNKELFYVIEGSFNLTCKSLESGLVQSLDIQEKDLFIIPPYVTHSFLFCADTLLLTAYDNGVEIENGIDIWNEEI